MLKGIFLILMRVRLLAKIVAQHLLIQVSDLVKKTLQSKQGKDDAMLLNSRSPILFFKQGNFLSKVKKK